MLYQALLRGRRRPDAGRRPPGRAPLRRHGAGPAGRRHLLPVPHAAEPRPRRRARAAHGAGARGRRPSRSPRSRSGSSSDEYETRIDQLKKEIEAEIRRRLVADRGVEAMARTLRKPLPEDVDFMHASREEMAALRKAIYPLTRKLAVRLARKRRHGRKGPLDFRSTVRHSLSLRRRAGRAEVQVPAAVASPRSSSSPTSPGRWPPSPASRCTSSTPSATSSRRCGRSCSSTASTRSRSFFEGVEDITEAVHRVNTEADVVWVDGHSDYGHAFEVFWEQVGQGDRPQDHRDDPRRRPEQLPRVAVAGCSRRCSTGPATSTGSTPSPGSYWDTGDSIVGEYATHCDGTFECRNLRQLEKFVDHLA